MLRLKQVWPPEPDEPRSLFSPRRWFVGEDDLLRPLWRAALFVVLSFVFGALMRGALVSIGGVVPQGAAIILFYMTLNAGLLLECWYLLSVFDQRSFRTLGLWFYPGWMKEFLVGAGMGTAMITAVTAGLVLAGGVAYQGLAVTPGGTLRFAGIALVLFLAAAFEEIAFRGYGFQRLVDSVGPLGAVLIFSALFGAVHINNPSASPLSTANTVLAGVLLAVAYLKTRGLWLPIGLHWAWNYFLGPVYSLPVSGHRFGTELLRAEIRGPVWLSGGAYGPEGSVVLTVVCTAAVVWMARSAWFSPSAGMREVLKYEGGEPKCSADTVSDGSL